MQSQRVGATQKSKRMRHMTAQARGANTCSLAARARARARAKERARRRVNVWMNEQPLRVHCARTQARESASSCCSVLPHAGLLRPAHRSRIVSSRRCTFSEIHPRTSTCPKPHTCELILRFSLLTTFWAIFDAPSPPSSSPGPWAPSS